MRLPRAPLLTLAMLAPAAIFAVLGVADAALARLSHAP